ncbi:MAG: M48 family metalloprotease [Candidatus Aminicenantes bacterium]|nr:M48 family metalloprotease [Candidatus Aminicenantes bacterium]
MRRFKSAIEIFFHHPGYFKPALKFEPRFLGVFCLLLIVFLIFNSFSCAVNPVTQKRELMLLSRADELALGQQTDTQVTSTYGLYPDPALHQYVSAVGKKLAAVSHQPDLEFHFQVLDSPVVNAFAVPGGYVYLTRGILAYLNDEAELAGVMGHEIGHVTARHSAQLYSKAQVAQIGLVVGAAVSKTLRKFAGLAEAGLSLLFLSFSREHERQADELGVLYASKAGYEGSRMSNMFVTLQKLNPKSGNDGLPTWLSTHPDPPDRIAAIKKAAADWQAANPGAKLAVNRDDYLRHLDGLIFGEDPRQGYVKDNVFYHPRMTFQFPVPANWKVNNTASQVQMISATEDAAIILTFAQGQTPDQAAQDFVTKNKLNVISSDSRTINGFLTRRLQFSLQTEEANVAGLAHFIQKDDRVLMFLGYTESAKFNSYAQIFSGILGGFQLLTDQARINVSPEKIKIIKAPRTDTLVNILKPYNYDEARQRQLAVLNALALTDRVQAGTLLKIISK